MSMWWQCSFSSNLRWCAILLFFYGLVFHEKGCNNPYLLQLFLCCCNEKRGIQNLVVSLILNSIKNSLVLNFNFLTIISSSYDLLQHVSILASLIGVIKTFKSHELLASSNSCNLGYAITGVSKGLKPHDFLAVPVLYSCDFGHHITQSDLKHQMTWW
jgi:hypothetical protein